MVLQAETRIVQNKSAFTQYLVIPSVMVQDSQYIFRSGDKVRITVDPYHNLMIITPANETRVEVSSEGIYLAKKKIISEVERE